MISVHSPDRDRFPSIREDHGEDPARFLDRPLFIRARIRGIDTIALVRAWMAVERRLWEDVDRRGATLSASVDESSAVATDGCEQA
jgi:hypothetical protein